MNDNINENFKSPWYNVSPTLVDQASPFDFKLVNLKNTGYIFLGTAIFSPFAISILMTYLFNHNEYATLGMNFISWIIVGIGAYFVISSVRDEIFRSGAIAFYYFYFIPNILNIIVSLIISPFHFSKDILTTVSLLISLLAGIITILVTAKSSRFIFKKIKLTFKHDYIRVLIVGVITIVGCFLINYLFGYLQSLASKTQSENQNNLTKGLSKWWNVAILFIYTILIAPIVEELACRHGIFSLVGNKWIGFVASVIFFAGMHVSSNGDWEHIIGYLGSALSLAIIFVVLNGNVTYSIVAHAGLNCITAILLITIPSIAN